MDDLDTTKKCDVLPSFAYTSLNRCNLPASILGSDAYQRNPVPLALDCVVELHAEFFDSIKPIQSAKRRSLLFQEYMACAFLLGNSEEAGHQQRHNHKSREKLDYLRLLRGWMFNSSSVEGAIMKRWVESRFGLLTINHDGLLEQVNTDVKHNYVKSFTEGLYNSNALESQLDLVYSYCQYELNEQNNEYYQLYRGINNIAQHTTFGKVKNNEQLILLNNLNSFSNDLDACDTFGDIILDVSVPSSKILYFPQLLPGVLKGENEFLVIGGVYQARIIR